MISFLELPTEILCRICDFLPINDVLRLKSTSQNLESRINSRSFWSSRVFRRIQTEFPIIPGKQLNWMEVCVLHEQIMDWFNEESPGCIQFDCEHSSAYCIDAIHLLQNESGIFFVGDRGGVFSLFSVANFSLTDQAPVFSDTRTHKGWIWTISSDGNQVATGCWDSHLRLWNCVEEPRTHPVSSYKLNSAVLCSAFLEKNLLAAGTLDKSLVIHDSRAPPGTPALSNSHHQGAILCLESLHTASIASAAFSMTPSPLDIDKNISLLGLGDNENRDRQEIENLNARSMCPAGDLPHLPDGNNFGSSSNVSFFTGSKDHSLAAWDLRAFKKPVHEKTLDRYPRAISLLDTQEMWVAEPPNRFHVYNIAGCSTTDVSRPSNSFLLDRKCRNLEHVNSYSLPGQWKGFGDLVATPGAIFVTGLPGALEVLHPTIPARRMTACPLIEDTSSPPISLSFANETLLVGLGNGIIRIWMSRRKAEVYGLRG